MSCLLKKKKGILDAQPSVKPMKSKHRMIHNDDFLRKQGVATLFQNCDIVLTLLPSASLLLIGISCNSLKNTEITYKQLNRMRNIKTKN